MARIEFDGVWKQFSKLAPPAVQDLNLSVADGEMLVVLGPSGCGKTTALRMLAGLEDPDAGDIRIDGRSVVDFEPKDRDIALVFQQYALYPHLTARNNILYPLKVQHLVQAERRSRVERVAQLLGIGRLLDRKPAQLSGGEQQRVALGRAIVRQPRVFLMDEPLSNLDAQLRLQMRTELKALQRELGITTFFVTHDQAEAMTLADRIAVMSLGRLQQIGTPDEVYDRPANLFVAEFLGSPPMNILPAERTSEGLVAAGIWHLPLPAGYDPASTSLRVGLRPEAIELVTGSENGGTPVEVFLSEPLGSEVIVNARIGDALVKIRTAPDVRPRPGESVQIRARADGLRLYDGETGKALWA
jgi:multiple sugar transport system ATP-binding protein